MIDDERLLQILSVAHRTSMRGEGVSLSQALADTEYRAMRSHFDANDLRAVIDSHPELIHQWERYSEDKRTDGGWYLKASDSAIGSLTEPAEIRFGSVADAVANYAIRELDFWAGIGAT
jgi:hypothetical protein